MSDLDTLPARETAADAATNIDNETDLFDDTVVHSVEVEIDADDRQRMLDAFREDGEKIVVPATITIDGVRIEDVGIRLKGNSSLGMLGGRGGPAVVDAGTGGTGGDRAGADGTPDGGPGPDAPEPGTEVILPPEDVAACMAEHGVDVPAASSGPQPPPDGAPPIDGGPGADRALPYLVIFDEYVPGQRYQGLNELALRAGGVRETLAESLSIAAYDAAGLAVPRTAPAGVSINGEAEQLYSVTEHPDQTYVDRIFPSGDGALFKITADQSQRFDYVGDDPTDYDGFDQVTGRKRFDKQPLIELLRFVEESSDDEFAAGLDDLLDVESLARMLALNNILQNWDAIGSGPGGNYYLWYDAVDDRFAPLAWDFNLSLGGSATASPEPLADPGPGGGAVVIEVYGDAAGDAPMAPIDEDTAAALEECVGDGAVVVAEPTVGPEDDAAADAGDPATRPGVVVDVAGSMTNALVERFVGMPQFRALYDEAMQELSAELLTSGALLAELDGLATALTAAAAQRPSLATADDLSTAVSRVRQFLDDRGDFLSTALD